MEIILFSANVHQCNIEFSVVHLSLLFFLLYFFLIVIQATVVVDSIKRIDAVPVDLCEWKITTEHPMPTIISQNTLRTFEAEMLKIVLT